MPVDYKTYQTFRRHCRGDLAQYLDTPAGNAVLALIERLDGPIGELEHEQNQAMRLFQCKDLTPREGHAAHLLAVINNHRSITWQREPNTPDGKPPTAPLEQWQVDRLWAQTQKAVTAYAQTCPEIEKMPLLELIGEVAPALNTATAAPVVTETVAQRRARYLAMFETEQKQDTRGALQRVANSEGVDRSNMRKDIDKARAARDEQKRAGVWISRLVQDGKRTG